MNTQTAQKMKLQRVEMRKLKIDHCIHCNKADVPLIVESRKAENIYYTCRKCNTTRAKIYRETPVGKANIYKASYKSMKIHKLETECRMAVHNAVASGKLKKPSKCSKCKQITKVDGHHKSYYFPLKVEWLCRTCHADIHKQNEKIHS